MTAMNDDDSDGSSDCYVADVVVADFGVGVGVGAGACYCYCYC